MDNKKVMVRSLVNHHVGMIVPELNFRREWPAEGATLPIDLDILKEAIYYPGVEYLFKQGMLYIDDMDVKIELGLEPPAAKEPVNIIILNDGQRRRLLTVAPLSELREKLEELTYEQRNELADFAIRNKLGDLERAAIIKEFVDIDIISAIRNRQAMEEE